MKIALKIIGLTLTTLIILLLWSLKDGIVPLSYPDYSFKESSITSWEEILKKPSNIEVIPIRTGYIKNTKLGKYAKLNPQNKNYAKLKDKWGIMDTMSFAIKHPSGDILIDTGFNSSFSKNPKYGDFPLNAKIILSLMGFEFHQDKNNSLKNELKKRKLYPKKVFYTHLHIDHTAGNSDLPSNIECIFEKKELDLFGRMTARLHLKDKKEVRTFDFTAATNIVPLGPCIDLLGDGSLWAISTPGHTQGHTSYLVNAQSGPILITGDLVFFTESWKNEVESIGNTKNDTAQSRKSLLMVKKLLRTYPQIKIFMGHEKPSETKEK